MNVKIEETINVTLELNKEEAIYLLGLLQNPIVAEPDGSKSETPEERLMRHTMFEQLKRIRK